MTTHAQQYVDVSPDRRGGIPVLRGTRITVAQLLAEVAEGRSVGEIAADFDLELGLVQSVIRELSAYLDRPVRSVP